MSLAAWFGVAAGAATGALIRWRLGIALNPVFPTLPLGTLCANLIGGLLMGLLIEFFARNAGVPPALRIAVTTGFLGGLTTFSTFSAETVNLLLRGEYAWGSIEIGTHVAGSLAMTILGIFLIRFFASLRGFS